MPSLFFSFSFRSFLFFGNCLGHPVVLAPSFPLSTHPRTHSHVARSIFPPACMIRIFDLRRRIDKIVIAAERFR